MKNSTKTYDFIDILSEKIALKLYQLQKTDQFNNKIQLNDSNMEIELKPKNSDADKEIAQDIYRYIDNEVVTFTLYLEPRLTLRQVSEFTEISEKEISWAINTITDGSFSSYINNKRITFFKQAVSNGLVDKQNILAWAFKSGFNSKSSFNLYFKEKTGYTPSEFLSEYEQELDK